MDSQPFNIFHDMILPEVKRMEESVLKQVLKQVLHREPREKDAKKCTKVYEDGEPLNYYFSYRDQVLGRVVFDLQGPQITVTFKPNKIYS